MYWGNGFATEATLVFIEHIVREYRTDLIWSSHFSFNNKSKRVLEKCGFKMKFSKDKTIKSLNNKLVTEIFYYLPNQDIYYS